MSQPIRCFRVDRRDNVATLLDDASSGPPARLSVLGGESAETVNLLESIEMGHKIALRDIAAGEPVIKYGMRIGRASREIRTGQWVHLHNCASFVDERSQHLDPHSGAATDTKYE